MCSGRDYSSNMKKREREKERGREGERKGRASYLQYSGIIVDVRRNTRYAPVRFYHLTASIVIAAVNRGKVQRDCSHRTSEEWNRDSEHNRMLLVHCE